METKSVIEQLQKDLKPVKTWRSTSIKYWGYLASAVYLCLVLYYYLPPHENLSSDLKNSLYKLINLIPLVIIFLSFNFFHYYYDIGIRQDSKKKTIFSFAFLLLSLGLISLAYAVVKLTPGTSFLIRSVDWYCFRMAMYTALPILLSLQALEIYLPRRSKGQLLFRVALSVGAGVFVDNIHCPVTTHGHSFLGHFSMPLIGGFILAIGINIVFRKLLSLQFNRKFQQIKKS